MLERWGDQVGTSKHRQAERWTRLRMIWPPYLALLQESRVSIATRRLCPHVGPPTVFPGSTVAGTISLAHKPCVRLGYPAVLESEPGDLRRMNATRAGPWGAGAGLEIGFAPVKPGERFL